MSLQVTDLLTFLLFSSSAIRLLLKSLKTLPKFSPPLCPRVRVPCFRLHHTRTQLSVLTICSKYLLSCTKHFKPWLKTRIPFILITNPGFDGLDKWFTLRILRGCCSACNRNYHQSFISHIWHLGWEASKVPLDLHMIFPRGGLLTWGKSSHSECPRRHWQSQWTSPTQTQKSPRSPPWHSIIKAVTKTCHI